MDSFYNTWGRHQSGWPSLPNGGQLASHVPTRVINLRINIWGPEQNGSHFADNILFTYCSMMMFVFQFKFHCCLFRTAQWPINHHWFWWWLGINTQRAITWLEIYLYPNTYAGAMWYRTSPRGQRVKAFKYVYAAFETYHTTFRVMTSTRSWGFFYQHSFIEIWTRINNYMLCLCGIWLLIHTLTSVVSG